MWRSNYQEDWERRKTYLIRSLFQDIPVLSPVPEDQESRYGAGSPSDIPLSRPHSPLPPLIIERMPNRHDHPKKFYQELENKMKKLYKKLFLNEGSSSVEDLLKTYGDNFATSSLINEFEDYCRDIGAGNASLSTVKLDENRSQPYSSSEHVSPTQATPDRNFNESLDDGLIQSRSTTDSSNSPQRSGDLQSSTRSLCQTKVTTVVEVHKEPSSDRDETLRSRQLDIYTSPVLEYHRIGYSKTLPGIEFCQQEGNELLHNSTNEISGTETSGSANKESPNEDDQFSSSEISLESIEVMRRQKENSPSLGSLQNEPIGKSSSQRSSSCLNLELRKIFSLDLPEENFSSEGVPRNLRDSSFSSASIDFSNVLTTSTPKLKERSKSKSFSESSGTHKRVGIESFTEDAENKMVAKRQKCENIAIQTSLISESDANDFIGWNQLKKNFFVGVPTIYKLCPCNDHACASD